MDFGPPRGDRADSSCLRRVERLGGSKISGGDLAHKFRKQIKLNDDHASLQACGGCVGIGCTSHILCLASRHRPMAIAHFEKTTHTHTHTHPQANQQQWPERCSRTLTARCGRQWQGRCLPCACVSESLLERWRSAKPAQWSRIPMGTSKGQLKSKVSLPEWLRGWT